MITRLINYSGNKMELLNDALKQYGASLAPNGRIYRNEKPLNVKLVLRGNRVRFESSETGNLLFSGPIEDKTVESFIESFWFWEKE